MPRPKKNPAAAPAPAGEAPVRAKAEEKTARGRRAKTAPAEQIEELYLQLGGKEWNITDCKARAAAAYAAAGHDASEVRKLAVYLKPEEGKVYYVVNDGETGSIDL